MFIKLGQLKKKLAFCYLPNRKGILGGHAYNVDIRVTESRKEL